MRFFIKILCYSTWAHIDSNIFLFVILHGRFYYSTWAILLFHMGDFIIPHGQNWTNLVMKTDS